MLVQDLSITPQSTSDGMPATQYHRQNPLCKGYIYAVPMPRRGEGLQLEVYMHPTVLSIRRFNVELHLCRKSLRQSRKKRPFSVRRWRQLREEIGEAIRQPWNLR